MSKRKKYTARLVTRCGCERTMEVDGAARFIDVPLPRGLGVASIDNMWPPVHAGMSDLERLQARADHEESIFGKREVRRFALEGHGTTLTYREQPEEKA